MRVRQFKITKKIICRFLEQRNYIFHQLIYNKKTLANQN